MTPEVWLRQLSDVLAAPERASAQQRRGTIDAEVPDGEERTLLLDLARIAAHTSERWAAPLTTYMAGHALADTDRDERITRLRALVAQLDEDAVDGEGPST